MALTWENWTAVIITGVMGLCLTGLFTYFAIDSRRRTAAIAIIIVGIILTVGLCGGYIYFQNWRHTSTGNGMREYKDWQSDLQNGIERTIKIIENDGSVIFEHEGKFDIEMHSSYIVYDEQGIRTIIYKSYTSTILIEEEKG